jgi:glutathione S-transferase
MLKVYGHPFASYHQKVAMALYENATPFELALLAPGNDREGAEFAALWPLGHMPVMVDGGRTLIESTIIIEHLDIHHPGPRRFIPREADAALAVRFMDRFFDSYVMTPMQKIVGDSLRGEADRDRFGVAEAHAALDTSYGWLQDNLADGGWAAGEFSLADCAAAPALFYADWVHPIAAQFPKVIDYRRRLLARPSFARAVDEARPYRKLFPLGAPDRD